MNQFLYYSFIIILYILSAFSFVLIPYSIIKLKRRTSKYIYISKFFVYFGYYCITTFLFIFVDAIHFNGINYKSNNILYLIITMLILALLGVVLLWMWIHYEIHIQDDKFIYSNLFYGKSIIEFSQIDIKNYFQMLNTFNIYIPMVVEKEFQILKKYTKKWKINYLL